MSVKNRFNFFLEKKLSNFNKFFSTSTTKIHKVNVLPNSTFAFGVSTDWLDWIFPFFLGFVLFSWDWFGFKWKIFYSISWLVVKFLSEGLENYLVFDFVPISEKLQIYKIKFHKFGKVVSNSGKTIFLSSCFVCLFCISYHRFLLLLFFDQPSRAEQIFKKNLI